MVCSISQPGPGSTLYRITINPYCSFYVKGVTDQRVSFLEPFINSPKLRLVWLYLVNTW